jgi:Fur family zinc uptake transcriptional regulator
MSQTAPHRHGHHEHTHDARAFVDAVASACELHGLRLTPLRLRVLELIAAESKPVKAYELLDRLKDEHSGAAPPTIYRALDFLLEHRFIHKLESINAFVGCHHPNEAHQVPFLICDICSNAVEICDERVSRLLGEQARDRGFRPRAQTLEVHGVCANCRAAAEAVVPVSARPYNRREKFFCKPRDTPRRGPYCGAPTPMPVPSRSS